MVLRPRGRGRVGRRRHSVHTAPSSTRCWGRCASGLWGQLDGPRTPRKPARHHAKRTTPSRPVTTVSNPESTLADPLISGEIQRRKCRTANDSHDPPQPRTVPSSRQILLRLFSLSHLTTHAPRRHRHTRRQAQRRQIHAAQSPHRPAPQHHQPQATIHPRPSRRHPHPRFRQRIRGGQPLPARTLRHPWPHRAAR